MAKPEAAAPIEAAPEAKEPETVIFRSPYYEYSVTLWNEQRAYSNQTNSYQVTEPVKIARFQDVGIGGEYRTSDPREIARLRELAQTDKRGLYEVKTGREHLTEAYLPARKPGQTYRGNRAPVGEIVPALSEYAG